MDLDPGSPPKEFCWDPSTNPDTYIYDTYMIKAYNWCAYKEAGLQKLLQPCSRAARKWRESEEIKRKWRENEEMERE